MQIIKHSEDSCECVRTGRKEETVMRLGLIKARFIGEDGSMGLKRGRVYLIQLYTLNGHICVSWTTSSGRQNKVCPYSSLKTLCANWESI